MLTQQVMNRFAQPVEISKAAVVPQVVVRGGGGSRTSSSVMERLLTLLLSDKLGVEASDARRREPNLEANKLRTEILEGLKENRQSTPGPGPLDPATTGRSAAKPA